MTCFTDPCHFRSGEKHCSICGDEQAAPEAPTGYKHGDAARAQDKIRAIEHAATQQAGAADPRMATLDAANAQVQDAAARREERAERLGLSAATTASASFDPGKLDSLTGKEIAGIKWLAQKRFYLAEEVDCFYVRHAKAPSQEAAARTKRTALESFAIRMSGIDPHPDVSARELVDSIRTDAIAALAQQGAAQAPRAVQIFTCKGKGGEYELIGYSNGAGPKRGESIVVYFDTSKPDILYHRSADDFRERMEWLGGRAAQAAHAGADTEQRDDFARGVIAALGVLKSHGYPHGSVLHDEIVQSVGEKVIYAAAEDEDYAWAGLNPRKKPRKRAAIAANTSPEKKNG